jgi:curved DNA-binding protein
VKDYYSTLGVAEQASADEIKKAYRKLAKQNHPDATGGDVKKGERFKEISEAYSVLSDATKRSQYDQLRQNPYAQNAEWGNGTGVDIGDIFAQFFGGGARVRAGAPGGAGPHVEFHSFSGGEEAPEGFGDLFEMFGGGAPGRRRGRRSAGRARQLALLELELPEAALGTIKTVQVGGQTLQVRIPPGVEDGARLRAGDTSFQIRVRPHAQLRREGADIHTELPISVTEALLGAKIDVPTLDGGVALTVPAGTSSGAKLRLRGKGAALPRGGRGDQYVHIRITAARELSARARQLVEQLAEEPDFKVRR